MTDPRMCVLTGHHDPVNQVVFRPDGQVLASAGDDACIWLWDCAIEEALARISWGARYLFSIAWSPDGQAIAAGVEDALLMLRAENGGWHPFQRWRGHNGWTTAAAFSTDGQMAASGGGDGEIFLWDAGRRVSEPLLTISPRLGQIRSLAFSPDGISLAAGCASGIGLWRATEPEPLVYARPKDSDVRAVAFSRDGRMLVAAAGRSVLLIDVQLRRHKELVEAPANYFLGVAVADDDHTLAFGCEDGSVRLWDLRTGQETAAYQLGRGAIRSVACNPVRRLLAAGGDDFTVHLVEF